MKGRGREGAGLRVGRSQGRGGVREGAAWGGVPQGPQEGPQVSAADNPVPAPPAGRSVMPTTSTCALAATTAPGTSGSQKPAPSPRFAPWEGGALRLLARGEEGPGGPPREGKAAPAPRAALPSSPTSSTTRAPCCSPCSRRCGVSRCGTWGAAELHTQWGHAVRPLLSPGCSHRVPGVVEAGASPCGPAVGPVRVGRGPGEAEPGDQAQGPHESAVSEGVPMYESRFPWVRSPVSQACPVPSTGGNGAGAHCLP